MPGVRSDHQSAGGKTAPSRSPDSERRADHGESEWRPYHQARTAYFETARKCPESDLITKAQAAKLHHQDHQIRKEERIMASQNGGHITKQEQRTLNQQENAVSPI